jgi:hypothetical protein
MCASDMAILLGPGDPEVRAAGDRAREILAQLGARPLLERLDAAVRRGAAEPRRLPAEPALERTSAPAS